MPALRSAAATCVTMAAAIAELGVQARDAAIGASNGGMSAPATLPGNDTQPANASRPANATAVNGVAPAPAPAPGGALSGPAVRGSASDTTGLQAGAAEGTGRGFNTSSAVPPPTSVVVQPLEATNRGDAASKQTLVIVVSFAAALFVALLTATAFVYKRFVGRSSAQELQHKRSTLLNVSSMHGMLVPHTAAVGSLDSSSADGSDKATDPGTKQSEEDDVEVLSRPDWAYGAPDTDAHTTELEAASVVGTYLLLPRFMLCF